MRLKTLQRYLTEYTYIYKYMKGQNELYISDENDNQLSIYENQNSELLFTFFLNGTVERVFIKGTEKVFKTLRECFQAQKGINEIYEKINIQNTR